MALAAPYPTTNETEIIGCIGATLTERSAMSKGRVCDTLSGQCSDHSFRARIGSGQCSDRRCLVVEEHWPDPLLARELWSEHWPDSSFIILETIETLTERTLFETIIDYLSGQCSDHSSRALREKREVGQANALTVDYRHIMGCRNLEPLPHVYLTCPSGLGVSLDIGSRTWYPLDIITLCATLSGVSAHSGFHAPHILGSVITCEAKEYRWVTKLVPFCQIARPCTPARGARVTKVTSSILFNFPRSGYVTQSVGNTAAHRANNSTIVAERVTHTFLCLYCRVCDDLVPQLRKLQLRKLPCSNPVWRRHTPDRVGGARQFEPLSVPIAIGVFMSSKQTYILQPLRRYKFIHNKARTSFKHKLEAWDLHQLFSTSRRDKASYKRQRITLVQGVHFGSLQALGFTQKKVDKDTLRKLQLRKLLSGQCSDHSSPARIGSGQCSDMKVTLFKPLTVPIGVFMSSKQIYILQPLRRY
eukprot:sb/3464360/